MNRHETTYFQGHLSTLTFLERHVQARGGHLKLHRAEVFTDWKQNIHAVWGEGELNGVTFSLRGALDERPHDTAHEEILNLVQGEMPGHLKVMGADTWALHGDRPDNDMLAVTQCASFDDENPPLRVFGNAEMLRLLGLPVPPLLPELSEDEQPQWDALQTLLPLRDVLTGRHADLLDLLIGGLQQEEAAMTGYLRAVHEVVLVMAERQAMNVADEARQAEPVPGAPWLLPEDPQSRAKMIAAELERTAPARVLRTLAAQPHRGEHLRNVLALIGTELPHFTQELSR